MKTVNLIPQWFLAEQKRRRRQRLHLLSMVAIGCLIVGWAGMARQQLVSLRAQRDALAHQIASIRDVSADLQQARQELHRLQNLQSANRELGSTVPMSAISRQVMNDMTPGMALSNLVIEVRNDPVKSDGRIASDGQHPTRFHQVAHIGITGVAPDSMQIAQLIGKLSGNPLFSDVALNFSRSELLRDYSIRRFDIQLEMDLDRIAGEDVSDTTPQARTGDSAHAG
jgi:hypothetical protein